jgi:hypothetical protein
VWAHHRDLFDEDGGGFLTDPELLNRLELLGTAPEPVRLWPYQKEIARI